MRMHDLYISVFACVTECNNIYLYVHYTFVCLRQCVGVYAYTYSCSLKFTCQQQQLLSVSLESWHEMVLVQYWSILRYDCVAVFQFKKKRTSAPQVSCGIAQVTNAFCTWSLNVCQGLSASCSQHSPSSTGLSCTATCSSLPSLQRT